MFHSVIKLVTTHVVHILVNILDKLYPLSYRRFFVLETIARIPYYSYVSVLNLYQSLGKHPRIPLQKLHFKQTINETWHLLIMEELGGGDIWYDRFFARSLGFIYFWATVVLYIISPQNAYHMMEIIEDHAYSSYESFITKHADTLTNQIVKGYAREYIICISDHMKQSNKYTDKKEYTLLDVFAIIKEDEKSHSTCMGELSHDVHGEGL